MLRLSGASGSETCVRCTRNRPSRIHSNVERACGPVTSAAPGKQASSDYSPTKTLRRAKASGRSGADMMSTILSVADCSLADATRRDRRSHRWAVGGGQRQLGESQVALPDPPISPAASAAPRTGRHASAPSPDGNGAVDPPAPRPHRNAQRRLGWSAPWVMGCARRLEPRLLIRRAAGGWRTGPARLPPPACAAWPDPVHSGLRSSAQGPEKPP
jgi:hypothetical protein